MAASAPSALARSLPPVSQPTFRSGAVARMAGMPVATLRIWEQRYQAVRPTTAPSGHRLYSESDVERVTVLRRLTQQGHAIGLLAPLDLAQMQQLLSAPFMVEAPSERAPLRVVVVGQGLALRLQRLAQREGAGSVAQWAGFFDSLADAVQAVPNPAGAPVDLLVWQTAGLQTGVLAELRAAQTAWSARSVAVTCRYSNAAARAELADAGIVVGKEPGDDESLGSWLASLQPAARPASTERDAAADVHGQEPSPPRFTDAGLMAFAGLSSSVACECPGHLAELILQISHFETYSGDCAHRNAADAQLHADLQRVAGAARVLFEAALERVAVAEGLPLPSRPAAHRPASLIPPA